MARGLAGGTFCGCWEYIGEEQLLDRLLQDWSWHGWWQQEGIAEGGRVSGRGSNLVSSAKDCSWQGRWQQNGEVEGGSVLVPRGSSASWGSWKRTR